MDRRGFLGTVAGVALGFHVVPRHVLGRGFVPPSEKLAIAGIGIGGRGRGVLKELAGESIVALCDVDSVKAGGTFDTYPRAERSVDYRVLLDKQKNIDAVMIATPDHMHAPITLAALRAGKHVYVEKPMAHSIEEARVMAQVAQARLAWSRRWATTATPAKGSGLAREWLQAGAIGPVREIHSWSDRPGKWWKSRTSTGPPAETPSVPPHAGLGPLASAPRRMRPYSTGGITRTTGEAGSTSAPAPSATWPSTTWTRPSTRSTSAPPRPSTPRPASELKPESYPALDHPPLPLRRPGRPPRPRPSPGTTAARCRPSRWDMPDSVPSSPTTGSTSSATRGRCSAAAGRGRRRSTPQALRKEFATSPRRPSPARSSHYGPSGSRRARTAGPRTPRPASPTPARSPRRLLVGNLALRLQKRIEWDTATMKATNAPEAEPLIHKRYRPGFGIGA